MPTKLSFRLFIYKQRTASDLGSIEIAVSFYSPDGRNSYTPHDLFKIVWYTELTSNDNNNAPLGVFGFKVVIEASGIYDFEEAVKSARRFMKKLTGHTPLDVIEALEAIGAVEVVNDTRERQMIPLGDVKGPEWIDWLDDYKRLGKPHCMYSTLATSEVEAKAAILTKASKGTSDSTSEWVQEFMAAGMPVLVNRFTNYPNITPAIERLREDGLIKEKEDINYEEH